MRHDDGTPDDPALPPGPPDASGAPDAPGVPDAQDAPDASDDELATWSDEAHRELELLVARDREAELVRRHEAERVARVERAARLEQERRRREAELPPELRDADDEPYDGGPRRRLVMGSSKVLAAVALLAAVAVAVTGFL